ncbi:peptidylprolyl isomerase [Sansalvadorimonas sp. 2012CJ34-2]|uniref:Chaperone SurA n=1 Tax=Parendozoicomonas callyspongiae TaxID=2942213 RepID=A0ABT0PM50_9GAMM|nr:peptidylprolyl isomerase [Sansalvadorimonas sp. 2012CJ34-2]MCL6271807.1 peptidylprolyl isomerase [Sansalvadorimonas sp. 2012CJ34-2]
MKSIRTFISQTAFAAFAAMAIAPLTGISPAAAEVVPLDKVVAIVDNDVVMESELNARLKSVQAQLRQRTSNLPPEDILKQQVLDRLIIENLQLQIADRAGARIDDNSLNQAISNIARNNGMTLEQFRKTLQEDGMSYADARDQIRREMLINRVRQRKVLENVQVTDREVQNFKKSAEGKQQLAIEMKLGHILVSLPEGATPDQIQAANAKAEAIYKKLQEGGDFAQIAAAESQGQNALEGGDLGWRKPDELPPLFSDVMTKLNVGQVSRPIRSPSGFHILKVSDRRGDEKVMQEQVKARHILIKPNEVRSNLDARELAENLYKRLEGGADFAELAKAYSDDTGSALNGGSLGWADPNNMVPAFREKMLTEPLNVATKPFQSRYGWHILEVEGRRQEDVSNQMQDARIREMLRQRKYEEELQVWLRELRDQAYVEIKL